MARLTAEFSAAFSRDLKKKAKRCNWDLAELQGLIDLVLENTPESLEVLERRHNIIGCRVVGPGVTSVMLPTPAIGW